MYYAIAMIHAAKLILCIVFNLDLQSEVIVYDDTQENKS